MKKISSILKERYEKKYLIHGKDIKSLGWDRKKNQSKRFEIAIQGLQINSHNTILDVGCGFGDLANFLKRKKIKFKKYTGIDVNQNFIKIAKSRESKNTKFFLKDFCVDRVGKKYDYIFILGFVNFNLNERFKNLIFLKSIVKKAFEISNKVLVFDFITSQNSKKNKNEKFIYYYNPEHVLKLIQKLTSRYQIRHDYESIPKKECNVKLYK